MSASPLAVAGEMGMLPHLMNAKPVVSLFGGVGAMSAGRSQTYIGTDENIFAYSNQSSNQATGIAGVFLGVEHQLQYSPLLIQTGIEYTYFSAVTVNGTHLDGIDPATSTIYSYQYRVQPQQFLAVAKLLTNTDVLTIAHHPIMPFVSVGLGAAFNQASQYSATTQDTLNPNLTPFFTNNTQAAFSYSVGLGAETQINDHVRAGLGYRFSGFGDASLGRNQIVFGNASDFVPFTLTSNPYANQFIVQISYVI